MQVLRSWPARIPPDRGYVVDNIDRIVIDNYDYSEALANVEDDILLLEWDIAVDRDALLRFGQRAQLHPDRVAVAPYRIYAEAYHIPEDIWAHRHWGGEGAGTMCPRGRIQPVATGDPTCNLFGLGMVYLPRDIIRGYIDDGYARHMGDVEFSMWHYQKIRQEVHILWDVHPVHLHYNAANVWKGGS